MITKPAIKKQILIASGIYLPDIGGPASYAHALGEKLAESCQITLIAYSSVLKWPKDKTEKFKVIRVWNKIPKGLKHAIYFFRTFFTVRKTDVVFALNAVSAGLPAMLASKIFKKKFIVKIVGDYAWETAVNENKTPFLLNDFQKSKKTGKIKRLSKLQTLVAKSAHKVIVPSEYLSTIVEGWGVPAAKIEVIYNGSKFRPSILSREEARIKIGIAGSIILTVGRLVPWKGFKMLIKIMPKLLEINGFFRLVIVGDGPEMNILKTIIKNLQMDKKIYVVGKKNSEELAVYLAASDIFVLNTGYEGFSHQILEAMAAGVPIITTAVGGNREIINQGENGFMIKYNDEFNLIEAIKTLWQSQDLRNHFIEEEKKTVDYFSFRKMIEKTTALLLS